MTIVARGLDFAGLATSLYFKVARRAGWRFLFLLNLAVIITVTLTHSFPPFRRQNAEQANRSIPVHLFDKVFGEDIPSHTAHVTITQFDVTDAMALYIYF